MVCLFYFSGLQYRQNHGANGARTFHHNFNSEGRSGPHGLLQEPFFETVHDPETGHGGRNITTAEGGKAILLCTIRHLGNNNTVSVCSDLAYALSKLSYPKVLPECFIWYRGISNGILVTFFNILLAFLHLG